MKLRHGPHCLSKQIILLLETLTMPNIEWPAETAQIVDNLKDKITEIIETDEQAKADFDLFMERLHATPDGSIKVTREEAIEFFVHWYVTKPALYAILGIEKRDAE